MKPSVFRHGFGFTLQLEMRDAFDPGQGAAV
jgi:hypothetical protein